MLRENALYSQGSRLTLFQPLNDDLTIPVPDRVIAGAGPFDMSAYPTPAAIPLSIKLDTEVAETHNINLGGVGDISAVTAAEVRDAINAAVFTDFTASLEAGTNRLQLAYTGSENPRFVQIYGDLAPLCFFGQGFIMGQRIILSNTIKSIAATPQRKESEDITDTDANGKDVTLKTDGYKKGTNLVITDVADDPEIKALLEGGDYDISPTDTLYEWTLQEANSDTIKIYFWIRTYYPQYEEGENKEGNIANYKEEFYRSCVGDTGDVTHERNWANGVYNVRATSYTDESGNLLGDAQTGAISVENYETLDLEALEV